MPEGALRLSLPHIDEDAIEAVAAVLRGGHLVHGVQGEAFEVELEQWLGVKHALLVSSGTAALHLALLALDIGAGDAVLVPDFTFPATANVVRLAGARPVLVDVDPSSYCMTAEAARATVESWRGPERVRAILPVHEFGCPAPMAGLRALAREHGLELIEDAACAIGARDGAVLVGTLGDIGCFSLHPRKTLTTGEGGILVTDDDALAARVRRLRSHGMQRSSDGIEFLEPGLNYRLTDFQAALGRAQLPRLEDWIRSRRALAACYFEALQPLERAGWLSLPGNHAGHSWQTFMVVLDRRFDRSAVVRALAGQGIETNLGAQCLSSLASYAGHVPAGRSPNARRLFESGLALPFCEQYGVSEVARVCAGLSGVLEDCVRV